MIVGAAGAYKIPEHMSPPENKMMAVKCQGRDGQNWNKMAIGLCMFFFGG